MIRLLFWIGVIVLVVMAVRSKLRAVLDGGDAAPQARAPGGPAPAAEPARQRVADQSERMACCARCGLHFPSSEAVLVNGREYCSRAHAPAG